MNANAFAEDRAQCLAAGMNDFITKPVAPALLFAVLTLALAVPAQAADKLSICYVATYSLLVPLAKLRGFYAAEGLDVEVRSFSSGIQTLDAMFAGECALATAADPPVVRNSLSRNDLGILAAISVSNNVERIIVRSDRGIHTAADRVRLDKHVARVIEKSAFDHNRFLGEIRRAMAGKGK